jgi:hypothetical protein
MRIPDQIIRLKEYHEALETALADPDVPVYPDTSVLMWLLRIGAEARTEFLTWCRTKLTDRVIIPTWTAHELYHHLREGTILADFSKRVSHYRKTLTELLKDVSTGADPTISAATGYASTSELVGQTRERIMDINNVLNRMENNKSRYEAAVSEVITFVNERMITSHLFSLLEPVTATQSIRFEGRIPPGYKDAHKLENTVGDLFFWQEIVKDLANRSPCALKAIIITRDEKTDWYCKPIKIETYDGHIKGELHEAGLEAKLPHPMLEHELKSKTGTKILLVVNPRILSVLLDKLTPASVKALTAVTHPRTLSEKSVGINTKVMGYAPFATEPEEVTETTTVVTTPKSIDLNTLDLKAVPSLDDNPDFHMLVGRLSGIIPDRNEAAAELLGDPLLLELVPSELLFLGRRLYRVASSLSAGGVDVFDIFRAERSVPDAIVNALALGMFIELYFDDELSLRPTPLDGPFTGLFELQTQARFEPCIQRVTDLLASSKQLFLAPPSTEPITVDLRISFDVPVGSKAKLLRSLLCSGRELLCDVEAGSQSALNSLFGKETATVEEICAVVSRRFFIPITQIKPDREPSVALSWTPLTGVSHCRTDFGGVVDDFTLAFEKDIDANG